MDWIPGRVTGRSVAGFGLLATTAALAIVFALLLPGYYAANQGKQRLQPIVAFVERHAQPGEDIVSMRFRH